jgi:hypothetical protein
LQKKKSTASKFLEIVLKNSKIVWLRSEKVNPKRCSFSNGQRHIVELNCIFKQKTRKEIYVAPAGSSFELCLRSTHTSAAVVYIIFYSSSLLVILYGELLVLKHTNKQTFLPVMNLVTKCVKRITI